MTTPDETRRKGACSKWFFDLPNSSEIPAEHVVNSFMSGAAYEARYVEGFEPKHGEDISSGVNRMSEEEMASNLSAAVKDLAQVWGKRFGEAIEDESEDGFEVLINKEGEKAAVFRLHANTHESWSFAWCNTGQRETEFCMLDAAQQSKIMSDKVFGLMYRALRKLDEAYAEHVGLRPLHTAAVRMWCHGDAPPLPEGVS